jgi:hypothetical protein
MPDAQTLFSLLNTLVPLDTLLLQGSLRLHSPGYADLFAEVLTRQGRRRQISLAHFIFVGAAACPCPELEIEVDFETRGVRPLVIQFASGHQSRAVAFGRQGQEIVNQSVLAELSEFLATWIERLTSEGYTLRAETSPEGWGIPPGENTCGEGESP